MKRWLPSFVLLLVAAGSARADLFHSPKFKSPGGKYEIIIASADAAAIPFSRESAHIPPGQKLHYILLFYVAGDSEPASADWYTDIDSAPAADQIISSLQWSPGEEHVVVTHGQNAKRATTSRWLISLKSPFAYGFEGDHLQWIDGSRLVADLQTKKVPGGIELVDAARHHAELLVSPVAGIGYGIADVTGHLVTVKEFLNHWGDDREKTMWESFDPACFELNLDTLKKRSVPCPK
jgi:hypothetical protein